MRSVAFRVAWVVVLSVSLASGALATPRTDASQNRALRTVQRIIRSLGDLITIPIPAPTPEPKQP